MTTIKATNKATFVEPIVDGAASIIVRSEDAQVTYHATATTATTRAATGIVRRRSRSGTAGETASPTARGIGRADKNSPFRSVLVSGPDENTLNKAPRMRGLGEGRHHGREMGF